MSELDKHYDKGGEEHHARAARLRLNWYQGNITKYAERAPLKGSQNADIIKVLDYATLWLENDRKGVGSAEKLTVGDFTKLELIARRLLNLTGAHKVSVEMEVKRASDQRLMRTELSATGVVSVPTGVVLRDEGRLIPTRNYPGDGSVAGPDYANQAREEPYQAERSAARFSGS